LIKTEREMGVLSWTQN